MGYEERIKEKYSMFKDMATVLEEREGERFKLEHFTVSEQEVRFAQIRDRHGEYDEFLPGTYVKLVDKTKHWDGVVMSDTQMERETNMDLYKNANGHVLIGGLGLGMILLAIQDKPEVTKVTVVEKYQEVIDLVATQLPLNDKVQIIQCDVFDFKPQKGEIYDTIYMDIWNTVSGDFWEEHKTLTRKFCRRVNKENEKSWSSSWRRRDYMRLAR
jgi:spermidine synthase